MFTKTDIEKYFIAEKQGSLLFIAIGVAAIIIALLGLFLWKTQFWKGAAFPLIAVALIQIIAGYIVYSGSDKQRTDNVYAFDMNPQKLITQELPRIQNVNKNFMIYRYIEIALIIAGFTVALLFKGSVDKQFWVGAGIALALQATVMLTADYFAEQRAAAYSGQLQTLVKKN